MTIYIDKDFRCFADPGEGLEAVQTDFFDGKAPGYIEGYRFIPTGEHWTAEDGTVYRGEAAFPVTDWEELDAVQREYEREQYETLTTQNAEYEAALSEIETALGVK
jgi:hypothetical protein